jgi:hypothetical protein
MHLRRLLPILVIILALPVCGFGQDKTARATDKKDPGKTLQDNQQKRRADMVKSVPVTNKTLQVIRLQNKKATMEQMHTINKAIRKSMTVHKHK